MHPKRVPFPISGLQTEARAVPRYVCRRLETRSHLRINELDAQVPFQFVFALPRLYTESRVLSLNRSRYLGLKIINEIEAENNKEFPYAKRNCLSTISSRISEGYLGDIYLFLFLSLGILEIGSQSTYVHRRISVIFDPFTVQCLRVMTVWSSNYLRFDAYPITFAKRCSISIDSKSSHPG